MAQQIKEVRAAVVNLENSSEANLPAVADATVDKATKLVTIATKVTDPELNLAVYETVNKVEGSLDKVSKKDTKVASEARTELREALSKFEASGSIPMSARFKRMRYLEEEHTTEKAAQTKDGGYQ